MIQGLTPDQELIIKKRAAASRITEAPRKWIYNEEGQGVLIENVEDYEELKDFFELTVPSCDNKDIKVIKVGEAKRNVNKAKRDIEREATKKKATPKKKEEKTEA
jgi:hypothetical protein